MDKHTERWVGYTTGILCGPLWVVRNDPDSDGNIMSEADARLIATAPLGLALAREVVAWWATQREFSREFAEPAHVEQARALIALAVAREGEAT